MTALPKGQIIIAAAIAEPDPMIGATVAALVDVYEQSDCLPSVDVDDCALASGAAP